jgi:hypothetical protein
MPICACSTARFQTQLPLTLDSRLPGHNIGLQLTVPGSCPVEVPLPIYQLSLDPAEPPAFASDSYPETMSFKWDAQQAWVQRETGKQLYAAWVNQFNQPTYTTVTVNKAGSGEDVGPEGIASCCFCGADDAAAFKL